MLKGKSVVVTGSTSGIGLVPAIAVGVFLGGGFWSLVFFRGRPDVVDVDVVDRAEITPTRQWSEPSASLLA